MAPPVKNEVDPTLRDPNEGFDTGVQLREPNAFMSFRDENGEDPLQGQQVMDNAALINTEWESLPDKRQMEEAIENAFRAVLLSPRKNLRWNCHDEKTEALTNRGWMSLSDLRYQWGESDFRVAAYKAGRIVYERPQRFVEQRFDGELIAFQGRFVDMLVTPNHRMLTSEEEFIPADQIFTGVGRNNERPQVPMAGIKRGFDVEEFTIPGCAMRDYKKPGRISKSFHPDLTVPMDTWLRWLGWYISEGSLTSRQHPSVCQANASPVIESVKEACKNMGIGTSTERDDGQWIWTARKPHAKQLGQWTSRHIGNGARYKRLPRFVFDLGARQARILLHALLMGDGTADENWDWTQGAAFYTSSTVLAHDVQRLAVHCGIRAMVSLIRPETNEWKVSMNPGHPTRLPRPTKVEYHGGVWCFSLPSETMVTRRNGKVAISGNTVHYQDLMDARSTDPTDLWRHLEKHRQAGNVKNWGEDARYAHRPYGKLLPQLRDIVYRTYKRKVNPQQANKKFERLLFDWETQEQEQVMREERDLPEDKKRVMYQVENEANKRLAARIQKYIKERQTSLDEAEGFHEAAVADPAQEQMFQLDATEPEVQDPKDRYGAFMGPHLKAIAKISFYVEDILKAALEDVHQHDGAGHHFRASVMQLKVPGVGPKVCSFAWLLLQPLKSQLATIDSHMLDVLGRSEKEMNNRDYFKMERELQARRDAAGYSHIPLGAFQWGMWDYKRSGPGEHQDHSGLKVLEPEDYHNIDWKKEESTLKGDEKWPEPPWWELTKPEGERVGKDYEDNISPTVPQNAVPYQHLSSAQWHVASDEPTPWFIHPQTGERLEGLPGETLMQHMRNTMHLSTPEIWSAVQEAGKA